MTKNTLPYYTLTEAAFACGLSRQRLHRILRDRGYLSACERITNSEGRTLALAIPVNLVEIIRNRKK